MKKKKKAKANSSKKAKPEASESEEDEPKEATPAKSLPTQCDAKSYKKLCKELKLDLVTSKSHEDWVTKVKELVTAKQIDTVLDKFELSTTTARDKPTKLEALLAHFDS